MSIACPQEDSESPDLGIPNDLATMQDQALTDMTMMPMPGLSLLAGGVGGLGSTDGTGAAARFTSPSQMAMDGAGNLFLADNQTHTIRRVVVATGVVTTLAGSPGRAGNTDGTGSTARFNNPNSVAVDGVGNLYVGDSSNNAIRKVVVATGAVTSLAGMAGASGSTDGTGATARFNNPQGVALDGAGNLYVADFSNRTIRKVVVATGAVTTLAGTAGMASSTDGTGAAARFNSLVSLAMDGMGNLFATDGNTIRQIVVATAAVTTLAGTAGMSGSTDATGAAARFAAPQGVAADGIGNLFVTDRVNQTIRRVVVATGVVTTLAGAVAMSGSTDGTGAAARFNTPVGVAADGAGNVYIADQNNGTIRKMVAATGVVTTLAGAVAMAGNTDGTGAAVRFNIPDGVVADGAGNLFVADTNNHTIRKVVVATGVVTTLAGTAGASGSTDGTGTAARFNRPRGMAADGAGNLFVADSSNHTIRQLVVATGAVTTLAGTAGMTGSADGTGAAARFNTPFGVAVDASGDLYVADTFNVTIRKVVIATGVVTTLAGTAGVVNATDGTGAAAAFSNPQGLALDGAGNLFVSEPLASIIRKVVVATGVVTTLAGIALMSGNTDGIGAVARFSAPRGIAVDGTGNLYIADSNNNAVRKIQIGNASVTTAFGTAGQSGVKLGPPPTTLNNPSGLAMLPSGDLAILDENSVLLAR